MIGIIAAIAAKVMSKDIDKVFESYIAGCNLDRLRQNAHALQSLIDSADTATVRAVHNLLSEDPSATAFTEVRWPSLRC